MMENNKTNIELQAEIDRLRGLVASLEDQMSQHSQRSERDLEYRLATTLNNIPLAILNLDRNGLITSANPAFIKVFELHAEEIINKQNIKVFEPFSDTELREKIIGLVDNLEDFDIETTIPLRKESETFFRCRGIKVSSNISDALNFIIIIGDVSRRKLTEHELVKAKEKAEESDKLKTAFLASMSHEIRTPMNHIIGFLDFLKDPELPSAEREEFSQIIYESGQVLLRLIDDIIDIAKIEAGQLHINSTTFSLTDLLNSIWKKYNEIRSKRNKGHIAFRLNVPPNSGVVVHTDVVRLQQIIGNLLDNAFKFTDSGFIEFGFELGDDNVLRFHVKDSGPGIDNQKHELIFMRFRQLDYSSTKKHGGTGLGLAIIKGLVELMGGNIWLESSPGNGSNFWFTLPDAVVQLEKPATKEIVPTNQPVNWSEKTFLIVEDERTNFSLLTIMLRPTKVHIVWAQDGVQAIEIIEANNNIDLILMDIRLPRMDGYKATAEIKRINKSIPIIAQTAYAMDIEISKAMHAGCDDYVTKPIEKNQLISKISKLLND
ncbi:MAG: response regulator [Bacteroidetes bacterium]|nr:response regulator [Bacteroidota bacterium]